MEVFCIGKFYKMSAVLGIILTLSSCQVQARDAVATDETFLMDTIVTQTVYGPNSSIIIGEAVDLMKDIEKTYSSYLDSSIISEINANAGVSPVPVGEEERNVIKRCVEFSEQSDGLFDLTTAPLVKLWNITGDEPHIPTEEEIAAALPLIDYRNVIVNEEKSTVYLSHPDMELDFGATVKGYAVQKVLELYRQSDIAG